ncbi:hypothetical protein SCP_0204200 [Sparassis crispa]|uniref:Uncharacterized protein n=1 Tax=Sparassis crispa TaxID=139825 RepID=A0A401GAQ2_9APHY|nr:hypothetical protein SCP_0204200 [Sparassis crispa]GBE79223.1 hypothetical protein SCP_0204200 [Sparassis crispa]
MSKVQQTRQLIDEVQPQERCKIEQVRPEFFHDLTNKLNTLWDGLRSIEEGILTYRESYKENDEVEVVSHRKALKKALKDCLRDANSAYMDLLQTTNAAKDVDREADSRPWKPTNFALYYPAAGGEPVKSLWMRPPLHTENPEEDEEHEQSSTPGQWV